MYYSSILFTIFAYTCVVGCTDNNYTADIDNLLQTCPIIKMATEKGPHTGKIMRSIEVVIMLVIFLTAVSFAVGIYLGILWVYGHIFDISVYLPQGIYICDATGIKQSIQSLLITKYGKMRIRIEPGNTGIYELDINRSA